MAESASKPSASAVAPLGQDAGGLRALADSYAAIPWHMALQRYHERGMTVIEPNRSGAAVGRSESAEAIECDRQKSDAVLAASGETLG